MEDQDQDQLAQVFSTHVSGPVSEPSKTVTQKRDNDPAHRANNVGDDSSPTKKARTNAVCMGANPNNNLGS